MKKLALACSAFLLILSSCSSSDSSSTSTDSKLHQLIITGSADANTATYTYSGNKLLRIDNSADGSYEKVYYTGNLVTKFEYYDDTNLLLEKTTYTYNSDSKLASYTYLNFDDDTAEKEVFTYNANGTVSSSYSFANSASEDPTDVVTTRVITIIDGEVHSTVSTGDDNTTYTYTYDTKNNPYKNILGFDKLSGYAENENLGVMHNIVTETHQNPGSSAVTDTYTYTYNSSDFPTTAIVTESGTTMETQQFIYE